MVSTMIIGTIGCESEAEKQRKVAEARQRYLDFERQRQQMAMDLELQKKRMEYEFEQKRQAEEEAKRKAEEDAKRIEEERQAKLYQDRKAKAYDLANIAKVRIINNLYHGGQNKGVTINDWDYIESSDKFRIKMSLTWNGAFFVSNDYACDGTLTCKSDGSEPEWNVTWMSEKTKSTLSDIQWFAAGAALGGALSSK